MKIEELLKLVETEEGRKIYKEIVEEKKVKELEKTKAILSKGKKNE